MKKEDPHVMATFKIGEDLVVKSEDMGGCGVCIEQENGEDDNESILLTIGEARSVYYALGLLIKCEEAAIRAGHDESEQ